jgi:hypothetical protein
MEARITDKEEYGRHITLVCAHHPELSWSTKNIGGSRPDGSVWFNRSIFFISDGKWECECSSSSLRLHPMYHALESVPE